MSIQKKKILLVVFLLLFLMGLSYFYHMSAIPEPLTAGIGEIFESVKISFIGGCNDHRNWSRALDLLVAYISSFMGFGREEVCQNLCTKDTGFFFNIPGGVGCQGSEGFDGTARYCERVDGQGSQDCSCGECICRTQGDVKNCIEQENLACTVQQVQWGVEQGNLTLVEAKELGYEIDLEKLGDSCCACMNTPRIGDAPIPCSSPPIAMNRTYHHCFNLGLCPVVKPSDKANIHWTMYAGVLPGIEEEPCQSILEDAPAEVTEDPSSLNMEWYYNKVFKEFFSKALALREEQGDQVSIPIYSLAVDFELLQVTHPSRYIYENFVRRTDYGDTAGISEEQNEENRAKIDMLAKMMCLSCGTYQWYVNEEIDQSEGKFHMCDRRSDIKKDITFLLRDENDAMVTTTGKDARSTSHDTFYTCFDLRPAGTCSRLYCASIYCPSEDSNICPKDPLTYERTLAASVGGAAKRKFLRTIEEVGKWCRDKMEIQCPFEAVAMLYECAQKVNEQIDVPEMEDYSKCLEEMAQLGGQSSVDFHRDLQGCIASIATDPACKDFYDVRQRGGECKDLNDTEIKYVSKDMTHEGGARASNSTMGEVLTTTVTWGYFPYIDENGTYNENEPEMEVGEDHNWKRSLRLGTSYKVKEGSAKCVPWCQQIANDNYREDDKIWPEKMYWDERFLMCVWDCDSPILSQEFELVHDAIKLSSDGLGNVDTNTEKRLATKFKCLQKCPKDGCPGRPDDSFVRRDRDSGEIAWDGVCVSDTGASHCLPTMDMIDPTFQSGGETSWFNFGSYFPTGRTDKSGYNLGQ
tara:strand:+ start:440 stop:2854 length:2415 start_codon:yes stop_codon:yes gene_type:complete